MNGYLKAIHDESDLLPTEYHIDVDGETIIVEGPPVEKQ